MAMGHDSDIDLVVSDENGVTVCVSFTEMSDDGKPVCRHGLIVKGKFTLLSDEYIKDKEDSLTHCTHIEKQPDGTYSMSAVGNCFDFSVDSDLDVTVLSNEEYYKLYKKFRKKFKKR